VRAITGEHRNSDHGADEEDVKDDAEEREESLSTEEACQQNGEDGVEDCGAGNASDGLDIRSDDKVAVGEDREEVAVDAEDNSCAAEFNRVEDGLEELESCAAECHLDD